MSAGAARCFPSGLLTVVLIDTQTQEREAKAEMRRKAKELQQARRDAERSGKKVPAFGGFGSAGMTSISSGSIITDTIVEPEKPKISAAPARCDPGEPGGSPSLSLTFATTRLTLKRLKLSL